MQLVAVPDGQAAKEGKPAMNPLEQPETQPEDHAGSQQGHSRWFEGAGRIGPADIAGSLIFTNRQCEILFLLINGAGHAVWASA